MEANDFQKRIKKQPFAVLGDVVYTFLFESIITLKMLPGTKINEAKIAKDLGISRSPIRKAVDKLVEEQLIVKEDNKYIVSLITPKDYLQITQARVFIESQASYLAAQVINEKELEKLKMLIVEFEKKIDDERVTGFEDCDHNIHSHIVNSCGNSYIIEMYNCIQYRVLRYRYSLRSRLSTSDLRSALKSSAKSHWGVYYALQQGLSSVARDEAAMHADAMRDVFAIW